MVRPAAYDRQWQRQRIQLRQGLPRAKEATRRRRKRQGKGTPLFAFMWDPTLNGPYFDVFSSDDCMLTANVARWRGAQNKKIKIHIIFFFLACILCVNFSMPLFNAWSGGSYPNQWAIVGWPKKVCLLFLKSLPPCYVHFSALKSDGRMRS